MRIAFFGGTFDPPHRGHIAIAEAALTRLNLDCVLFAPVAAQPLKPGGNSAGFADRMAMVRLAIEGHPHFSVSGIDAARPGGAPNYTLDTLGRLRNTLDPGDTLFLLLGADSFLALRQWHGPAELLLSCDTIVAARPGFPLPGIAAALPPGIVVQKEDRAPGVLRFLLAGPEGRSSTLSVLSDVEEDISATEVRAALASGSPGLRQMLAPAVLGYIAAHNLYRPAAETV